MPLSAAERTAASKKAWETIRARKKLPPKPPKPKLVLVPHTPIKMPKDAKFVSASEMMARTVVLVLTFSGIGNRRQVDYGEFEVEDSNEEWFNTTKKLLDAEELKQITSLYGELRRKVERRALPSQIKKGVYLLAIDFVEEINADMKDGQAKLEPLVEKLAGRLGPLIADAKTRLSKVKVGKEVKNFFNPDDYPTANELRAAFKITWRFVYVDSAKNLEAVSKELYAEEVKKTEAMWQETRETIQTLLRNQFSEMVNHLVDKLQPDADGKTKVFRESSIEKMQDFLSTFDPKNITNDAKMKVLVDKAKSLITKADAEVLRTDDSVRDHIRHGFETIKVLLDPMVAHKKHRAIRVQD